MNLVEQIKPWEEKQILNERSLNNLVRAINLFSGSFALTIVHCNYRLVRQKILDTLSSKIELPFREIWWNETSESLCTKLKRDASLEDVSALMCLGLEQLAGEDLKNLFVGANLQRDRLKKEISCPLVLWLDDHALHRFWNFAPELANLAAPPIKFELSLAELNHEILQQVESLFAIAKDPLVPLFWQDFKIDNDPHFMSHRELELARREMQIAYYDTQQNVYGNHGIAALSEEDSLSPTSIDGQSLYQIAPDLDAKLDFVLGRLLWRSPYADSGDVYDESQGEVHSVSQIYYQCSLIYWQNAECLVEKGIVLFYMGSLWWHNSFVKGRSTHDSWLRAKQFFQEAIASFQNAGRLDLVAKYSRSYSGVLEQLKEWQELQKFIEYLIPLHQQNSLDLAQDYGYLAKIAMDRREWLLVKGYTEKAILALSITPVFDHEQLEISWFRLRDVQVAQCRLLLAQSYFQLKELELASELIESAIANFNPTYEPQLYARLLDTFHDIAFAQGRYLQAFEARQSQRSLEQQYGLIAFIGAGVLQPKQSHFGANITDLDVSKFDLNGGEIAASGRVQDVENLMERILLGEPRLTVIHGESGVGKSSLVNAGLIPALLQRSLIGQELLPIKVHIYPNWVNAISTGLQASYEFRNDPMVRDIISREVDESKQPRNDRLAATNLLHKLRKLSNLVQIVLIFDQFEEFFFTHIQPQERQVFINFWQGCLQIVNLKLVVSIREDYLHLLLELDSTYAGIDILSRDFRYVIGSLSIADTKSLVKNLTEQANFLIESDLIDELVNDLAGDRGSIRPIELQLVGSQLQDLNITTLADYRASGGKQNLVERSIKEVIKACGKYDAIAQQILILLTDDQSKRPLRTYNELRTGVLAYSSDLGAFNATLKILVGSGLVFQLLETSNNRYQLVHDYLVPFIRSQKEIGLRDELTKVRSSAQRSQARLNLLTKFALFGTFAGLVVVSGLAFQANQQRQIAEIGEIKALVSSAESKFLLNEQLDALTTILDSAQKLNDTAAGQGKEEVKQLTFEAMQTIVFNLRERYRFVSSKKDSPFYVGRFSPDGKIVAVAGFDGSVYLFDNRGKLISELSEPNTKEIRSISFSPDGKKLAASGSGSMVRIWDVQSGKVLTKFEAHQEAVFRVEFHPDGQKLLTGGHDGLIKIWDSDRALNLVTINPPNVANLVSPNQPDLTYAQRQSEVIQNASFSPDGKMIIAAKNRAISLWDLQGNLLANQIAHDKEIRSVKFHPDGDKFASSSNDKSVKIWQISSQILASVSSNSPQYISRNSANPPYVLINSLNGNRSNILSLAFSRDGGKIALGAQDNSIQVFELNGMIDSQLGKHRDSVLDLDFSPDNQFILSAGKDRNARLWFVRNTLIETMYGHKDTIWSVSFNPQGKTFASGSVDKNIHIWNLDGTLQREIKGHSDIVYGVSFSSDGQKLLSASRDRTVRVWDSNTGAQLHLLKIHGAPLIYATLSPDQKVLATLGEDQKIKLWRWDNTDNPQLMHTFSHSKNVWSIAFSPDSKSIASTGDHQAVKVWDVASGEAIHDIAGAHGNNGGLWVAYSNNGKYIGSVGKDGKFKLWNSQSGKLEREIIINLDNANAWSYGFSFSPDDRNVAVANADKTIKIFDITSGELLKTLSGHTAEIHAISYSPDGEYVVSASRDSTLKLWKAETLEFDKLVQRGCSLLKDYLQNSPNSKPQKICDK
ncbi:MAG: hypothetical protein DCE90_15580 [Pseudanabaena sp.]|nr:MAG: hypothetical protein DCE90_15580 [Pseudanabaena sp.]